MRKTVREAYIESLEDALEDLALISRRFEQQHELVETKNALVAWRDQTAERIKLYGNREDSKLFLKHVDLDVLGFTGGYIENAIRQYDDLLRNVLQRLPSADVRGGYADDVRTALEQIDELMDRLVDAFKRSQTNGDLDYQTAEEGLRRWKDDAYKSLTEVVGEDEAGEIYSMAPAGASWGNPNGSIEEQYEMFVKYLRNIKEEIQKYPHKLISSAAPSHRRPLAAPFVSPTRIKELRAIKSPNFDLARLIALCEELNVTWAGEANHATAMLVRAIMDHVPPIFGVTSFVQVASNYAGSKSFKEAMAGLEAAARKIGDSHLHTQIRKSEVLPTPTQVNSSQQVDVLLAEIVRILK